MRIKRIGEDYLLFDGGYKVYSYHPQDCCEHHWLDFSVMETYNLGSKTGKEIDIYKQDFDITRFRCVEQVEGMGIMLVDSEGNKYLVNGYGENNGYYNDKIILSMKNPKGKIIEAMDVSECQEIEWC